MDISSLASTLGISSESAITEWQSEVFNESKIRVFVAREDAIHPWIQGNKWHKLKPWLEMAIQKGKIGLASMGGPYSNHLIALGNISHQLNLPAVAFIRGQGQEWAHNPLIQKLRDWNVDVISVERGRFRNWHQQLEHPFSVYPTYAEYQWIPLGGSDSLAISGVADWAKRLENQFPDFSHLVLPIASGGTLCGFASGLSTSKKIVAIEVLKGHDYLVNQLELLNQGPINRAIDWISDYHFGGFARSTDVLNNFCDRFFLENGFHIEPVYSGKAFHAVSDLAKKGHFREDSVVLLLHTGGVFPWNTTLNA